jgi:hypothetical protein
VELVLALVLAQHVVRLERQQLVLVLVLVQGLEQRVALLELRQEQVRQHVEPRWRRRNQQQLLRGSKRHHASTGCRRRFSTADCRGPNASCQKRRWNHQPVQSQPGQPLRTTRRLDSVFSCSSSEIDTAARAARSELEY